MNACTSTHELQRTLTVRTLPRSNPPRANTTLDKPDSVLDMSTYGWSYAPTNRATCKGKCGEKIAKGAVRLGVSSEVGDHTMVSYRCLACVTDKQVANIILKVGSLDSVDGFDGLEEDDQAAVLLRRPPAAGG